MPKSLARQSLRPVRVAAKYHRKAKKPKKNEKMLRPCDTALRLGDEDPEFGPEPADETAGHEVDDPAVATIDESIAGHFGL